jgi:hypothetical protein
MNGAEDLRHFLEQSRVSVPNAELQQWVDSFKLLISDIEGWLAPLRDAQLLSFQRQIVHIEEPAAQPYSVEGLRIVANGRTVQVVPRAHKVLGGAGRVDLVSGARQRAILLNADGTRKISIYEPNQVAFHVIPLTEDSFSDQLRTLLA